MENLTIQLEYYKGIIREEDIMDFSTQLNGHDVQFKAQDKTGKFFNTLEDYSNLINIGLNSDLTRGIVYGALGSALWSTVKTMVKNFYNQLEGQKIDEIKGGEVREKAITFGMSLSLDRNTGFTFRIDWNFTPDKLDESLDKAAEFVKNQKSNEGYALPLYVYFDHEKNNWIPVDVMQDIRDKHFVNPTPPSTMSTQPKKIFFSYSKHDRAYLEQLSKHLKPLTRNGKIESWDDTMLIPGEEWNDKIKSRLNEADIILLLTSANALATDYIWDVEITHAMKRHEEGTAIVIPVILSPCDWIETPLQKLNGLPIKGKPVSTFDDQNLAWLEVVDGIKKVINLQSIKNTNSKEDNDPNLPPAESKSKATIQKADKIYNIGHIDNANFS